MFELEKSIAEWRQKSLAAGIKSPIPMEELENHLREEIERLMRTGMDAKSACEAAMEKIGAANALKIEFEKVEKKACTVKQAKLILAFGMMTMAGVAAAFGAMVFFRLGTFSELTSAQQFSCYGALSLMLLFVFIGRFGCKIFPSVGRKRIRDVICVSVVVALATWWTTLSWGILPRHEYTMGELLVVILWSFIMPVGLMFGLVVAIGEAARKSVLAN